MDNIELLMRQGTAYVVQLLCDLDGQIQASVYLPGAYETDFCEGVGATYQEAMSALNAKLGDLFAQFGLPPHWDHAGDSTQSPEPSIHEEPGKDLVIKVVCCELAYLRYKTEMANGKTDTEAMRRGFYVAVVQYMALSKEPVLETDLSAFLVTVRDFIREPDKFVNVPGYEHLYPQI